MLRRFSAFLRRDLNSKALFNVTFQFTTRGNTLADLLGSNNSEVTNKNCYLKIKFYFENFTEIKQCKQSCFSCFFLDIS